MSLPLCVLPPDTAGYSVKDGLEVIETQLDGGASRFRRDILGAASKVNVTWKTDAAGFRYLRSLYRAVTVSGSLPFEIDLILDNPELTRHQAYFIPGSMHLSEPKGESFNVKAELEVKPLEVSQLDYDYFWIYNEFGDDWQELADFDYLINVEMVFDLAGIIADELSILNNDDGYSTRRN